MIFLVELVGSYCGLMTARTLRSARKKALLEHGTRNLSSVRRATQADIAHVKAMGGYVPLEGRKTRQGALLDRLNYSVRRRTV